MILEIKSWGQTFSVNSNAHTLFYSGLPAATYTHLYLHCSYCRSIGWDYLLDDPKTCVWIISTSKTLGPGLKILEFHLKLFVTLNWLFMNRFCGVLLGSQSLGHDVALGSCALSAKVFGWMVCVAWNLINAMVQGFPAEYCTVARWSLLFIKTISGFHVVVIGIHDLTKQKERRLSQTDQYMF